MVKKSIVFIVISFVMGNAWMACSSADSKYLVWSDEFEIDGLPNPEIWSYDIGDNGWGNNELQFYTARDTKNARVENGLLILEVHKDSTYEKGYTSARILTKGKASWKYGYIEVRAKIPQGLGTWPAIWMLPEEKVYGNWPKSGEIDIMEHVGYEQGIIHGTVHTESFNHMRGTQKGNQQEVLTCSDEFHVYAIDWKSGEIDFFIDGEKYHTFVNTGTGNPSEWPFDQSFYLIFNIAVGGNWGGAKGVDPSIWPQRMEVDYVRVYSQKP